PVRNWRPVGDTRPASPPGSEAESLPPATTNITTCRPGNTTPTRHFPTTATRGEHGVWRESLKKPPPSGNHQTCGPRHGFFTNFATGRGRYSLLPPGRPDATDEQHRAPRHRTSGQSG